MINYDIWSIIIKFLNNRDLVSLRLCSTYFRDFIKFRIKLDDERLDVTWETQKILRHERCMYCCVILSTDDELVKHHYQNHLHESVYLDLRYDIWKLVSLYDLECVENRCNCKSKEYLTCQNITRYLTPVQKGFCIKYCLYTDYGVIFMDTDVYQKKHKIFTEFVLYEPIAWRLRSLKGYKCARILQTKTHHWVILKYSNKIIPVKNIVRLPS